MKSFSLGANKKHFSNTQELLRLLDEIIIPYVEKERDMLQLAHDHPALLIIDVSSGQLTKAVIDKMHDNYIKLEKVLPNMKWYSACIVQELDNDRDVESISI